jgi:hypothetical protein
MSEPWMNDFRALRDHTRRDAPSAQRTRELVLASAMNPETPKEKQMTLIRRRPVLAMAIALGLIAIITPVAYAVVNKVFLEVDPEASEEEIEKDVTEQLEAAGYSPSSVRATKSGDRLEIGIEAEGDQEVPPLDVAVRGHEGHSEGEQHRVRIEVRCDLSAAQMKELTGVVSSDRFLTPLRDPDRSDEQLASELRAVLKDNGFADATVTISGNDVAVTVASPPK